MPATVTWHPDYPNAVVLIQLKGDVTTEDMRYISDTAIGLANNSPLPIVHNLIDGREMTKLPISLKQLKESISPERKSPKLAWVIILLTPSDTRSLFSFMITALSHFFDFKFRMFYSISEGVAFLEENDSGLSPLRLSVKEDNREV